MCEPSYLTTCSITLDVRLLLHSETTDGSVIPVWEEVRPGNVAAMKDVMSARKESNPNVNVIYRRVPITAERSPDFSDFSELIAVMLSPHMAHTPIVVNDQLGRGRSTLTSVSVTWVLGTYPDALTVDLFRSSSFFLSNGSQSLCPHR